MRRKHSSQSLKKAASGIKSVTIAISPQHDQSMIYVKKSSRFQPKKKHRTYPLEKEEAACMIQGAWRRHIVSV